LWVSFSALQYNKRTDSYGGTVRNRARLSLEIAEEIRMRVDSRIAVGLQISFDECLGDAGITEDDSEELADLVAASGLLDFLDISAGGYQTLHIAVPPANSLDEGFMVPLARKAKDVVGSRLKIFAAGRIIRLSVAETIIATGAADMVAMTRAHVADPFIVRKALENREHEQIHCVGANVCQQRLWDQHPVACVVNPVVGREAHWGAGTLDPPRDGTRRIAVVGAGPAGLRIAALAAHRGHAVTLIERDADMGGHLRTLSRLPTRETWAMGIDDLVRHVARRGVDIWLGVEATTESLGSGRFDTIVCATGADWDRSGYSAYRPERTGIPGADLPHVVDIDAGLNVALKHDGTLGSRVLIIDESAGYLPLALAILLANGMTEVEIVTPHLFLGEDTLKTWDMNFAMPELLRRGVKIHAQHFVESIAPASVDLYDIWAGSRTSIAFDRVVLSMMRLPNDLLFRQLARDSRFRDVRCVGDALAPRRLEAIAFEAEQLGRQI
jgi:hypothetical protein